MIDLTAMAQIWRARPPSGRFIMHRMRRDHWCPQHGKVTRWHGCGFTCEVAGFTCLPGCSAATCKAPGVAA